MFYEYQPPAIFINNITLGKRNKVPHSGKSHVPKCSPAQRESTEKKAYEAKWRGLSEKMFSK